MENVIRVDGMMCTHCKARVEILCKAISGVENAVVDLTAKTVTISGNPNLAEVKSAIREANFKVVE